MYGRDGIVYSTLNVKEAGVDDCVAQKLTRNEAPQITLYPRSSYYMFCWHIKVRRRWLPDVSSSDICMFFRISKVKKKTVRRDFYDYTIA